jgi:hypothetical protein
MMEKQVENARNAQRVSVIVAGQAADDDGPKWAPT